MKTLERLIEETRIAVDKMSTEEIDAMLRKQGEIWAKSETQWAKDFKEGKCRRD